MWNNISSSYWLDLTVSIITDVHPVVLSLYISICPQQQQQQKVLKTSMTFQRLVSKQLSHYLAFQRSILHFHNLNCTSLGEWIKKGYLELTVLPFLFHKSGILGVLGSQIFSLVLGHETIQNIIKPSCILAHLLMSAPRMARDENIEN